MNNPDPVNGNSGDLDEKIKEFDKKVTDLERKQPTSFFGKIFTSKKKSNEINKEFLDLSNLAGDILDLIKKKDPSENQNNFKLTYDLVQSDSMKESLEKLFKNIFPNLKSNPFTQKNNQQDTKQTKMPKSVQNFFNQKLEKLRQEKEENKLKDDLDHKTLRKIEKGKLAIGLGHGIEVNKGATGTLIIKDINEKPVGIHKVSDKNVPIKTRFKNFLKSKFGGQLSYLSNADLAQPRAERVAYELSKSLGFNLAPPSTETILDTKEGVFQVFVKKNKTAIENVQVSQKIIQQKSIITRNPQQVIIETPKIKIGSYEISRPKGKGENDYMEAGQKVEVDTKQEVEVDTKDGNKVKKKMKLIELIDKRPANTFSDEEKTIFQKFIIFDYLIGNLDRHEENWFVTVSDKGEITSIVAIDNANAFPEQQPNEGSLATKNQYKWKDLNLAKQLFTKETQEFVKENLNPTKIEEVIEEIDRNMQGFFNNDMKDLMWLRAKVAFQHVSAGKTPQDLGKCSSLEKMKKEISNNGESNK